MTYEILDGQEVINTIIATSEFMSACYPDGNYRLAVEPSFNARSDEILAQLAIIDEQTTKPRTLRELALGNPQTIAWVTTQDSISVHLRNELRTLQEI